MVYFGSMVIVIFNLECFELCKKLFILFRNIIYNFFFYNMIYLIKVGDGYFDYVYWGRLEDMMMV